jgi:hypothetical protein
MRVQGLLGCCHHIRVVAEAQVVVGTEVEHRGLAIKHTCRVCVFLGGGQVVGGLKVVVGGGEQAQSTSWCTW